MSHAPASYTNCPRLQVPPVQNILLDMYSPATKGPQPSRSVAPMDEAGMAWRARVGARLKELREERDWSLSELERATNSRLQKSRLSHYELGRRLPGPAEALVLAEVFKVTAAYLLCLDDAMPLSDTERGLLSDFRVLPEDQRMAYARRIHALAQAYRDPVPDEHVAQYIKPAPAPAPRTRVKR